MIITEVTKQQRRMVRLTFDDAPPTDIDAGVFKESPYRAGSSISEEQLTELFTLSEERRMWERALYLLSMRSHSRLELSRKLHERAGHSCARHDCVERTLVRLEQSGLINDASYAESMARSFIEYRMYSKRRAVLELRNRGVDRETAVEAVDNADCDDTRQLRRLLDKKYRRKLDSADGRRKTAAALMAAGFDSRDVRQAICEYSDNPEERLSI